MINVIWYFAIAYSILYLCAWLDSLYHYLKAEKCTKNIVGIVVDIKVNTWYTKNAKGLLYEPVYRFKIAEHTYERSYYYQTNDPKKYTIGQEVLLEYEEKNPLNFVPSHEKKGMKKEVIHNFIILLICVVVWLCSFFMKYILNAG